jgi:hypothetical protein
VSNCTASAGGGGVIYQTTDCRLDYSRLTANDVGAIYVRECTPSIDYCEFVDNTSTGSNDDNGALKFYYAGGMIRNSTIAKNVKNATYGWAGVQYFNGAPSLQNTILRHNYRSGGTEEANGSTSLPTQYCLFSSGSGSSAPSFFDADGGDFHLREGSAGIDAGIYWGQEMDIGGLSVPFGAAPDIGAHEHRPDLDNDGLRDIDELDLYHTNPFDPDSDDDGMPDGWEVAYSLNPLVNDAQAHSDTDPLDNLSEYISGTSPTDPTSYFRVHGAGLAASGIDLVIWWQAATARVYTVYSTTNLLSGTWSPTSFTNVPGVSGTLWYTNDALGADAEFFKVGVHIESD